MEMRVEVPVQLRNTARFAQLQDPVKPFPKPVTVLLGASSVLFEFLTLYDIHAQCSPEYLRARFACQIRCTEVCGLENF